MLLIGINAPFPSNPSGDRLNQGEEPGVFHLPLFPIAGKKAENTVAEDKIGGDQQRQNAAYLSRAAEKEKENQQKQRIKVQPGTVVEKRFQALCHKSIISTTKV